MKNFATILLLATGIFGNSSAQTINSLSLSTGSLEIVLSLQKELVYEGYGTNTHSYDVGAFSAAVAPLAFDQRLTNTHPYDVGAFSAATNITMEVTFRNVGETKMDRVTLLADTVVVLDGKEFKRAPFIYDGVPWFMPKTVWRDDIVFSEFCIPPEALTFGRHTVMLRYAPWESNIQTIFIGPQK